MLGISALIVSEKETKVNYEEWKREEKRRKEKGREEEMREGREKMKMRDQNK